MSFSSLSMKQQFLDDHLSLFLRFNDVFNTMGFGFTTWDERYYQDVYRSFDNRILTVNLEYRFGLMKDRSRYNRTGRSRDRDSEGDFEIE
ncbi:MAG: outer membrane beta-barrel protein [Fidelibacterota bacterium]